jgi:glycosyltransferase involved in cell wall biosynthesis
MKVALVHDYLREYGGAERVLEVMHEIWPDAPLYTSFVDFQSLGPHAKRFANWNIRPSWVQQNWFIKKFHSPLRFLAPLIWSSFNLSGYDVVVSSSGWFMCRGVALKRPLNNARKPVHICYIHHPPRNLYGYATGSTLQRYWIVRVYALVINFFLRHYDYLSAQAINFFVANSKETARRVTKFYRRDSTVVYPPITNSALQAKRKTTTSEYYLSVGRLTYSKQIDVIIAACNTLQLQLKIVGKGKEEKALKRIAGKAIEFVGGVSDQELERLYTNAKALIFCALDEDFGMVPVEAMAHGIPVIALAQGGVTETVLDGKTGVLFDKPDAESLVNAIKDFESKNINWYSHCINHAQHFSKKRFISEFTTFVDNAYKNYLAAK